MRYLMHDVCNVHSVNVRSYVRCHPPPLFKKKDLSDLYLGGTQVTFLFESSALVFTFLLVLPDFILKNQ